jgi:hypothetical protein
LPTEATTTLNGKSADRIYYELQPIFQSSLWWQSALIWIGVLALLAFVVVMVRRDSKELPLPIRWTLGALRVFAVIAIVAYLLNPGQRSESRLLTNSRLAVLIDTSLSMELPAADDASNGEQVPRINQVIQWVKNQESIASLRQKHDLTIYRFGESETPEVLANFAKIPNANEKAASENPNANQNNANQPTANQFTANSVTVATVLMLLVWLCVAASIVLAVAWLRAWWTIEKTNASRWLAGLVLTFTLGLVLAGLADLSQPAQPMLDKVLFQPATLADSSDSAAEPNVRSISTSDEMAANDPSSVDPTDASTIDWREQLRPRDTSTRVGEAIQFVVSKERGGPLAGIVIFTDGQSNSGLPIATATAAAKNANVPLYPIGVGSIEALKNIEIAYLEAPPRVLPNDDFKLRVVLKSFGFDNRQVRLTVNSVDANKENQTDELAQLEGEQTVDLLGDDGVPLSIEFDLTAGQQGERRYLVEIESLEDDAQTDDNARDVVVEIVQRKTKVMLVAGGPSREFRFLRNQLFRDDKVTSDVWLQSASQGADQESNQLLYEFPQDAQTLFEYDCIVAFDPDWRDLSTEQTKLLERWVAEKAGGLLLIAGPVNTPEWTRRPRGDEAIDIIRDLYPVVFFNQGSARLKLGRFGGLKPFPISFTRAGRSARALWLGDSAAESAMTWSKFDGVFGYYAVNEAKPGADVLANFSDESTAINGEYPIYMAQQFYGAGRVFFQASGEMWRVRRNDVDYFQDFYDQLIRWASQGRLTRDSSRGVLLTDRDRCWVGDQIRVQAILKDPSDEPYMAESVTASLLRPDGTSELLELRSAGAAVRPGTFDGVVPIDQQGEYRVVLPVPESETNDILKKAFQAAIPDLEKLKPLRNDPTLQTMATETGGQYYVGVDAFASDPSDPQSPSQTIVPQDQETFLTGTLNRLFQQKLMTWLLVWITFAWCATWTIRRCHKLS